MWLNACVCLAMRTAIRLFAGVGWGILVHAMAGHDRGIAKGFACLTFFVWNTLGWISLGCSSRSEIQPVVSNRYGLGASQGCLKNATKTQQKGNENPNTAVPL